MPAPASRQRIRSRTEDRAGRRKRVADLRADGMAVADITAELGCSVRTVLWDTLGELDQSAEPLASPGPRGLLKNRVNEGGAVACDCPAQARSG